SSSPPTNSASPPGTPRGPLWWPPPAAVLSPVRRPRFRLGGHGGGLPGHPGGALSHRHPGWRHHGHSADTDRRLLVATMKILYGVQGTGNGHITRTRAMARELGKRSVAVDYLFSGRPADKFFDMEEFGDYRVR